MTARIGHLLRSHKIPNPVNHMATGKIRVAGKDNFRSKYLLMASSLMLRSP